MDDTNLDFPSRKQPHLRQLLENPVSGETIEMLSLQIIDSETTSQAYSAEEWEVVRRMVHATADLGLVASSRFSPGAIEAAMGCLGTGSKIYVDSNMIRAGLSVHRLKQACRRYTRDDILCHVADSDVAEQARQSGLPRSLFAVRKARSHLDGAVVAFGNAPVGLMELNRLIIEEGLKPGLVLAMPVGFVHVLESKEELMALDVPFIGVAGRRGGSPLVVSAIHALCGLAARDRGFQNMPAGESPPNGKDVETKRKALDDPENRTDRT